MRKLSGAKEKLGLRVHGLIVGTPEKQRADPAVLRFVQFLGFCDIDPSEQIPLHQLLEEWKDRYSNSGI